MQASTYNNLEMSKPKSISIFLLHGDPSGIRAAQISMSTIQAIAFRRNQLGEVYKSFPEMKRPGVYILIGSNDEIPDHQLAYIGESESISARLSYHNSYEADRAAKSFWTDTVVLISKDENLTKSHARYVESSLIRSVGDNPRWSLKNATKASEDAGKLPLPDRAAMDEFVDQTKTLVGALGWDLFRMIRGRTDAVLDEQSMSADTTNSKTKLPKFFYKGTDFSATMEIGRSGDFVICVGSKIRVRTSATASSKIVDLRKTLIEKGVLREKGKSLIFTSDYSFSSASTAGLMVCGFQVNGRTAWKLDDGTAYADWEASLSDEKKTVKTS